MRLKHVKGADETIRKGTYFLDNPYEYKGRWAEVFGNNNPCHIEIGMGKGNFIVENALKYPDINFIGIEKYDSVMVRAIEKSNELELNNLKLIRMDARNIEEVFDKEIDLIYLNFSDPWTKDRHSKRRLNSHVFLDKYDHIFKGEKKIIMKTDNVSLFDFSLETLQEHGYEITYLTRDLHNENDSDNIMTEYEAKFSNKGIKINKLIATKK